MYWLPLRKPLLVPSDLSNLGALRIFLTYGFPIVTQRLVLVGHGERLLSC